MGKPVRSIIAYYRHPAVVFLKKTLQLHDEPDHKPMFDLEPNTQRIELIEKSVEFDLTHVGTTRSSWPLGSFDDSGLHNLLMSGQFGLSSTYLAS